MPGMDGYETTRWIRQLPEGETIPIIALTASALESDRERCLAARMNDFTTKPFKIEALLRTLARWTGRLPIEDSASRSQPIKSEALEREMVPRVWSVPGVDVEAALRPLRSLGSETELYLSLVETFLLQFEDQADDFANIQDAGGKDSRLLRSHTLINSAAIVGASKLRKLAESYDELLRRDPEDSRMLELAQELVEELKVVLVSLKSLIDANIGFQPPRLP
jgi:two-component system, sensor histidine kinase and response regulator